MTPQDPILKIVKVSYFRLTLAALGSGLVNAFNTNKTSWVGLGLFLFICLMASRSGVFFSVNVT